MHLSQYHYSSIRLKLALLIMFALLPSMAVSYCTHTPPNVSPAAQRAFQADQVVQRLGELQQFTISLQQAGKVRLADARSIVTLIAGDARAQPPITGIVEVLRTAPAGWQSVVVRGWQALKIYLNMVPELATWVGILEPLIDPLVTQGGV